MIKYAFYMEDKLMCTVYLYMADALEIVTALKRKTHKTWIARKVE